jgi:hypothetical protein
VTKAKKVLITEHKEKKKEGNNKTIISYTRHLSYSNESFVQNPKLTSTPFLFINSQGFFYKNVCVITYHALG